MVSQTPLVYSPRQFSVTGTIKNTIIADHPLATKEAMMFFFNNEERITLTDSLFFIDEWD
jgi:hypothetical protein